MLAGPGSSLETRLHEPTVPPLIPDGGNVITLSSDKRGETRMATRVEVRPAKAMWAWLAAAGGVVLAFWLLRPVLTTFLLAFGVAYLLSPLVDRLERRGIARGLSILAILLVFTALLAGAIAILVPIMVDEVSALAGNVPTYLAKAQSFYTDTISPMALSHFGVHLPETGKDFVKQFGNPLADLAPDLATRTAALVKQTVSNVFAAIGVLVNLILFPVFLFYLLRDFPRLRELGVEAVPPRARPELSRRLAEVDRVLASFVHGELIVCGVMAVLYTIGLTIAGVDLAVVVGIASGLMAAIPFIGPILGCTIASVLAIAKYGAVDPSFALVVEPHLLIVWATWIVAWLLESNVITPRIVGHKVGLHPIVMMTAVIVGGQVFGFLGVLLAVPVTAAAAVFWRAAWDRYRESGFYTRAG